MTEGYGFGLFALPVYRDARAGGARIVRHLPSLADGYLSGTVYETARAVLYVDGTTWMSTGLMERESHAFHVHEARGTMVAAGLGMGMFAFAAARKGEVERVVVVERRPDVVAVMSASTGFEDWPCRDKVTILVADALDPELGPLVRRATAGRRPDYLFADIWPTCAASDSARDTAAMVRAVDPVTAGWWGQELSFGQWCWAEGRCADQPALAVYVRSVGVPVRITPGYAMFAADVVAAQLRETAATSVRWRERLRLLLGGRGR
ncbi:MAG: hypothetical protein ACFCUO_01100 [Rhodospirillales bacterium]